ncbi:hypothetical protein DFS34DRAFT_696747 [Phlyctochytrium arcticum]|nr:hypothetical protein DFS34DRAFT_696747 [Phlyctochytrium arcticum]
MSTRLAGRLCKNRLLSTARLSHSRQWNFERSNWTRNASDLRYSSTSNKTLEPTPYDLKNLEWTLLALDQPLIHHQTGIKIHVVGVHHHSPASLERVQYVIDQVKPVAVCLEVDQARLEAYASKAQLVLEGKNRNATPEDVKMAISRLQEERNRQDSSVESKRGVFMIESASSTSSNLVPLSDDERLFLSSIGINPNLQFTSDHIHYGLEMGTAVFAARSHGAVVRAIDIHPNTLRAEPPHSPLIKGLIQRFKLARPAAVTRATAVPVFSRFLAWGVQKLGFGSRNVSRELNQDLVGISDLASLVRIWKTFYSNAFFWWYELRNAIMVENLRDCVRDVAVSRGILAPTFRPTSDPPPTIVVVVGKSHVFGMAEMWVDKVQNLRFPISAEPGAQLEGVDVKSIEELMNQPLMDATEALRMIESGVQDSISGSVSISVRHAPVPDGADKPTQPRKVRPPLSPPPRSPPRKPTGITYVD